MTPSLRGTITSSRTTQVFVRPLSMGLYVCYFVDHHEVYTHQELMQWKSLEVYNYFDNGHVRTVEIWPVDYISCILRESVRRFSQLPRPCGDYQEIAGWVSLWLSG